jgi:predicted dehydrogenase
MHDGLRINGVKYGRQFTEIPDLTANDVDYYAGTNDSAQVLEQRAFVDAVLGKGDIVVTPMQALVVTRILDAVYESAKTGKPVYFDEKYGGQ